MQHLIWNMKQLLTMIPYSQLQVEADWTKQKLTISLFWLSNIVDDKQKVQFYMGFPNYSMLKACYEFVISHGLVVQ